MSSSEQETQQADFIIIHSDISNKYTRDRFREYLKDREGAEMLTESVYFMVYSLSALQAAHALARRENVQIVPLTASLPKEQKQYLQNIYETAFNGHFDEAERKLTSIEQMLSGDIEYYDKKKQEKRPYNEQQIQTRIKDVQYDLTTLALRISKRKQREHNLDLSQQEFRLRTLKMAELKIRETVAKALKARKQAKEAEGNEKLA